jgi:PAS domain S-box-containing protein
MELPRIEKLHEPHMTAPLPANESQRLQTLHGYGILDTPDESDFDEITSLAAEICETPIAVISLVDESRQWFKSMHGIDLKETPRALSFCTHALHQKDLLLVPDARQDSRFSQSSLVVDAPNVRFYAGSPLVASSGEVLGTLCVMDVVPRELSDRQKHALQVLTRQVMNQIQLRHDVRQLERSKEELIGLMEERAERETALQASERDQRLLVEGLTTAQAIGNVGSWEVDLESGTSSWSAQTFRIFETTPASFRPTYSAFLNFIHSDDRAAWCAAFEGSLHLSEPCAIEHRIVMADGRVKHLEERWQTFGKSEGHPGRAIGTCQDITERKLAEEERDRLFDLSLDMLCVANFDGWLEQVNPAWTQCLGWSAKELTNRPMNEFIHPEDFESTVQTRAEIVKGIPVRGFENRYRCKDGSYRWLAWNVHPLHGARKVFAVARDITNRKNAEQRLARLNRLYQVMSRINETIVRVRSSQQLIEGVCRIATDQGMFRTAFFLGCNAESGISGLLAHSGAEVDELSEQLAPEDLCLGIVDAVLRTGRHDVCNDLAGDPRMTAWRDAALRRGYCSSASFPIRLEDRMFGVLVLLAGDVDYFQEDEIDLLVSVTENVSFAIESLDKEQRRLQTEHALRASEATMAVAQRIGHFGSWEFDLTHSDDLASNSLRWSDEMFRMAGFEPGEVEMNYRMFFKLVPPEDWESIREALGKAIQKRKQYTIVHRMIRRDGEIRIIQETAQVFYDDQSGRPLRMIGNANDITEQRRAEETLRESEQRFRQLAENIQEVFWITDPTRTQILYVSPAYERIWGRTCESLYQSPRNWLDAIHPDDRERVAQACSGESSQDAYEEVYRIIRADGDHRWIHDSAYPVRNDRGEIYRMVGTAEDITGRKHSEEKLREQATLLDRAQDAIIVRDLENRILYWNRSAERLYGWSAAEATGRSVEELIYRDLRAFTAAVGTVFATGEWVGEIEQWDRSGKPLIVEGRWTLVNDDLGRPKSILAINTDITNRKMLEQQFLRAQRMESIGTLAGGIAHDLNNVLAPIMMSIDLLKMSVKEPKALEILSMIGTSARRGADMVSQVLSFARGMEGRRVSLQVKHSVQELLKIAGEAFPKNISLDADLDADLWPLEADPTQLHQVLLNLCVNSRDAMPNGGRISIRASNVVIDEHHAAMNHGAQLGRHICLEVEDTGTGMPPDLVDNIFNPFFTTKEVGKGTGLGLSTVMAIVKGHGGFIQVQSAPQKGSLFRVYLPSHSEGDLRTPVEYELDLPRGNGETVLIIDDEPSIRQMTRQILEAFGYHTFTASDGAEAISLFINQRDRINVVLTDMMMPVMDGPTVIRILKRLEPRIRVIGASGIADGELVAQSRAAGMKAFLAKPYTAEALLGSLKEVLAPGQAEH